jgi:hypothetical protein
MTVFWTWATAHYWLAFFLLLSVSKTIRVIFKAFFRIWTPVPRETPNDGLPPPTEAVRVPRVQRQLVEWQMPPAPKPEAPVRRRSMWDRILND